jgi:hypothetical protein
MIGVVILIICLVLASNNKEKKRKQEIINFRKQSEAEFKKKLDESGMSEEDKIRFGYICRS